MIKNFLTLRTNRTFYLDQESKTMVPVLELIIITSHPKYVNQKIESSQTEVELEKLQEIEEVRLQFTHDGLIEFMNQLSPSLQNIPAFEHLGKTFSDIVKSTITFKNPPSNATPEPESEQSIQATDENTSPDINQTK